MIIERTNASPALQEWSMRLFNEVYTFERDRQGRLVCEISNPYHIDVLLERAAYREVKLEPQTPQPVLPEDNLSEDAPPVEAKTPPKPRGRPRGRPARKTTRAAATQPSGG